MSAWDTGDMAAALPTEQPSFGGDQTTGGDKNLGGDEIPGNGEPYVPPTAILKDGKTPKDHGWCSKSGYAYDEYQKSSKQIAEDLAAGGANPSVQTGDAVGGVRAGDWAGNGAIYTWNDDFGDVGPRFPELEKQLFGSEFHVKSGIEFNKITSLEVIQEGVTRIMPSKTFEEAGLHPVMLENVLLAGYKVPTPIQQYTMPAIFIGHDIVACAQTGSGKTAAFLIPILSKLMGKAKKWTAPRPNPVLYQAGVTPPVRAEPLVLIVCPSRELATQIFDEARRFCYRTMLRPCVVYGGGPLAEQVAQLSRGCDLLIGTPGRLVDFITRPHILTLARLKYMVIDEADEMVGSDWETELNQIMSGGDQDDGNITYMMFSATFPKMAREMAMKHLKHDHVRIRVGRIGSTHLSIKQEVIYCHAAQKRQALFDLLMSSPPARTMIFVNSKRVADEVDDFLFNSDMPCTAIHSGRTQREREDSIRAFRTGKAPILITTGVAARGLDIANVLHVINYDLPSTQHGGIDEYIHRIGRTGRIGNEGSAQSFYNERDEDIAPLLVKILLETQQPIPDFLTQYIPEGYENCQGDLSKLKFEDDSENEEEKQESADQGADVENTTAVAGDWNNPVNTAIPAPQDPFMAAQPAPVSPQYAQPPQAQQTFAPVPQQYAQPPQAQQNFAPPPLLAAAAPAPQQWGAPASQNFGGRAPQTYDTPMQQGYAAQPPQTYAPQATQPPAAQQWGPSTAPMQQGYAAQPPQTYAPQVFQAPAAQQWGPSAAPMQQGYAAQPPQTYAPQVVQPPAAQQWGPSATPIHQVLAPMAPIVAAPEPQPAPQAPTSWDTPAPEPNNCWDSGGASW